MYKKEIASTVYNPELHSLINHYADIDPVEFFRDGVLSFTQLRERIITYKGVMLISYNDGVHRLYEVSEVENYIVLCSETSASDVETDFYDRFYSYTSLRLDEFKQRAYVTYNRDLFEVHTLYDKQLVHDPNFGYIFYDIIFKKNNHKAIVNHSAESIKSHNQVKKHLEYPESEVELHSAGANFSEVPESIDALKKEALLSSDPEIPKLFASQLIASQIESNMGLFYEQFYNNVGTSLQHFKDMTYRKLDVNNDFICFNSEYALVTRIHTELYELYALDMKSLNKSNRIKLLVKEAVSIDENACKEVNSGKMFTMQKDAVGKIQSPLRTVSQASEQVFAITARLYQDLGNCIDEGYTVVSVIKGYNTQTEEHFYEIKYYE